MHPAPELLLWSASATLALTFCVHTFAGGRVVARPLLADTGLPRATKWLAYYCWHIATAAIAALTLAFGWSALHPGRPDTAALATGLSAVLSLLSAGVALCGGIHPLRFPSTSLFAVAAGLGAAGLLLT